MGIERNENMVAAIKINFGLNCIFKVLLPLFMSESKFTASRRSEVLINCNKETSTKSGI
jgi:hypothetical protein